MTPSNASNHVTTCVGCGAPAPAVFVPTPYTCTFCHREQILQPPPAPYVPPAAGPFPAPPMGGPFMGGPVTGGTPVANRALFAIIPAIILAIAGAVVAFTAGGSGDGPFGPSRGGSGPGAGGVVPSGEHLQWVSWGRGNLVVADINNDGVEDFVGHYRILDLSTPESTQTEYIGGFDGKTFQRIWASPSMGTLAQASGAVAFGVAGDRVIATDYRAQAHILDLRTGKESRVFALSDRAKAICSPIERRSEVWIQVADNKNVVFNLETGAATPGPRPAWCAPKDATVCDGHAFSGEACSPTSEETAALYKAGINTEYILRDGSRAYVVGTRSPGTPVRLLASFDPRTQAITWQTPIAPDPANASSMSFQPATIAGNRVYLTYKTTTPAELHVVAFDASNGQRALDFKVPRGDEGSEAGEIVVSPRRIYIPHWTWLEVFEAQSGRHIETVGMW